MKGIQSLLLAALVLAGCAPAAQISDSSRFPGYDGGAKRILVVFTISPYFVNSNQIESRMKEWMARCSIESRYAFVEASYGSTDAETRKTLLLNAIKKVAPFQLDAVLEIAENSKTAMVYRNTGGSEIISASFSASLTDRARNAKVWLANLSLSKGAIYFNASDRTEALTRSLMHQLVVDGAITGCPETMPAELKEKKS